MMPSRISASLFRPRPCREVLGGMGKALRPYPWGQFRRKDVNSAEADAPEMCDRVPHPSASLIVNSLFDVIALFALLIPASRTLAAEPALKTYDSTYYTIHTDLPEIEAREAQVRMTRMVEEYRTRTEGFAGSIKGKLPFYLYANADDYSAAGGLKNSAGRYDGEKLMALTLRREDGLISLATWHVVQHEAFHQFADAAIEAKGGELPMWANEGLAEYFGEALFTGDRFETGLIPTARLARVRSALDQFLPLKEFVAIPREKWNQSIELRNYDQAWSLAHFLAHGESGRFQKVFASFLSEIGKGQDAEKAYGRTLGAVPDLEKKWRQWWAGLGDAPTAEGYAKATVEILTSFLGRAYAMKQKFASFDELIKTPPESMKSPADQWLPPGLFQMGVNQSLKMRQGGDAFALSSAQDGTPIIALTTKDGAKIVGKFLVKDGRVEKVEAAVLVHAPVRVRSATQTSGKPAGEMIR